MSKIPLTLDRKTLARLLSPLLYKCESTLLRDISRRKKSFPPFEELEGCRKKIFDTQKVINFYPPGIGAAIRRALERECEHFESNIKNTSELNRPPIIKSIGEELMATSEGEGDEDIT